jgi:threonyl-tRNA synthetase
MPGRLGAYYIDEHGQKKVPVMLHRAMLGSLERFIGILLEETAGNLPFWLAPVQAIVMNITDSQLEYAQNIYQELFNLGFRAKADLRNEKIGFKIREHSIERVPYLLVVGDKEKDAGLVAVRSREGKDLGQMRLEDFIKMVRS